jgi:hypothetical protein
MHKAHQILACACKIEHAPDSNHVQLDGDSVQSNVNIDNQEERQHMLRILDLLSELDCCSRVDDDRHSAHNDRREYHLCEQDT